MTTSRVLLVVLLGACSASPPSGGPTADPLQPLPPAPLSLTDVSADLRAVLEDGALAGACDRWRAAPSDERARLLCGKSMFFYESFGTSGVPAALVDFFTQSLPQQIGAGFSAFGLIADPTSSAGRPLGLAPTAPLGGTIPALAFTCASCHFAQLPDGRYAVGAPNHRYDYGRQILTLVLAPLMVLGGSATSHDPAAVAAVQPVVDAIRADAALSSKLLGVLLPLAGAPMAALSAANEHHYATWPSGAMDFLIQPLPIDDTVHTISKISALWSIPQADELAADGLDSAWLGWTGGTASVMDFLHGFVLLGGGPGAAWTDERLQPLADYLATLRPPANPSPPPAALVERGRALFSSDGCVACHDGPRGGGRRLYQFSEIGTDDALRDWLDPGGRNQPCCNLPPGAQVTLTHALKSPRLVGAWTMQRFLHNGALPSLDALFCLTPRPAASEPAFGTAGHDQTCNLPDDHKRALEAYLLR